MTTTPTQNPEDALQAKLEAVDSLDAELELADQTAAELFYVIAPYLLGAMVLATLVWFGASAQLFAPRMQVGAATQKMVGSIGRDPQREAGRRLSDGHNAPPQPKAPSSR